MIVLGYIVSDRKIKGVKGFVEFKNDLSSLDTTKPVLIVGLKRAKEYCGDKFNILNKKISDKVYWTFKKTEKREDFNTDIETFYNKCFENLFNQVKYCYVNIFNLSFGDAKKFINVFKTDDKIIVYINKGMFYFLYGESKVYGISLRILKYCGINVKKHIAKLKKNHHILIYDNTDKFVMDIRNLFITNEYILPYLISKEKE